MLSIFSCGSWPSVCLLQRNVYLDLSTQFLIVFFFFFNIVLPELFVYFRYWSLVSCFWVSFQHRKWCVPVIHVRLQAEYKASSMSVFISKSRDDPTSRWDLKPASKAESFQLSYSIFPFSPTPTPITAVPLRAVAAGPVQPPFPWWLCWVTSQSSRVAPRTQA